MAKDAGTSASVSNDLTRIAPFFRHSAPQAAKFALTSPRAALSPPHRQYYMHVHPAQRAIHHSPSAIDPPLHTIIYVL